LASSPNIKKRFLALNFLLRAYRSVKSDNELTSEMLFVQNEKCSKRGIRTKDTKGSENKKSPANNKCWVGGGEKKKMENSSHTHQQRSVHD
jgi:hypothetical protein